MEAAIIISPSDLDSLAEKIVSRVSKMVTKEVEQPMTVKEAADFLGLHENTIYLRVKAGTIIYHNDNGRHVFFKSELINDIKKKRK